MPEIIMESKNLIYTKVSLELIDDYLMMVNDKEVQQFIYKEPKLFTYEDEKDWVLKKLNNNVLIFSILEKVTNKFVGNFEFIDLTENSSELGLSITPKMQNKHYGTEIIKTMVDYAFNMLKLKTLYLEVFSNNERGIYLYKKLGFTEYDRTPNYVSINGQSVDNIQMKLERIKNIG